ncbi:DUF3108 domain-containing protein [Albimonas sp. CAU 1670]|uniref:DUF3108 domain-containing protein n=1 Tax=Albimonas sp. CAU 1670 TaxID=3032599 RepID=UPI0023DA52FA|nr:DUF3108 domain-containing protein [Albimonas sp. CAU 1670]MDF2233296.1 DUF3108 domain-containing protein [Albimonas sp. CAU 1670]
MRRSACLAFALALPALPAQAQGPAAASTQPAAETAGARELLYHLDWGPVALGEFRVRHEPGDAGALTIEARSRGLASMLFDFSLTEATRREADGGRLFTITGEFGDRDYDRLVDWTPGQAPEVTHRAGAPDEELTPVPQALLPRSVDPAAAVLAVLDQIEAGKGCAGEWAIYDGVRMTALTVRDEGLDQIEADRDWTYAGPARRCRLGMERLGGYPVDDERETSEADFDRVLWIAQMDGRPTPVRLQVSWPLGYATGRIDLR